jgi:hypothetical protein
MAFLHACTEPVGSIGYRLRLEKVPEFRTPPALERELQRRFGGNADVPEDRVGEVLEFLDDVDPQPTNRWGMAPIWFSVASTFEILDPATGRPLPGQDPSRFDDVKYAWMAPLGRSRLLLSLHNPAALAVDLCIPDPDDDVLRRVVPWLQQNLPFKFSPKQWKVWTPTKSRSLKGRKMTAPRTV